MFTMTGVVLAGGQSSRMGQDKALLTRDHRDMFFYTQDLLESLSLNQVVISRNPSQLRFLTRHTVINDKCDQLGPLGGIYSVAQSVSTDGLLIMPIDMPLIEKKDLQELITVGKKHLKPVYYQNNYLPLFLPLTAQVQDYLNNIATGKIVRRSVKALCDHFSAIEISPEDADRLQNTNTPQQWQQAKLQILQL